MTGLSIILACNFKGGIGYKNTIPWNIPGEMQKFKDITSITEKPNKRNAVIMGRHTWLSLQKSLPNRLNIIISSNNDYDPRDDNTIVANSIENAVKLCQQYDDIDEIFIIGGYRLYNDAIKDNILYDVKKIYISVVYYDIDRCCKYDTYVNFRNIFKYFTVHKDDRYEQYTKKKLFASYICLPKNLE